MLASEHSHPSLCPLTTAVGGNFGSSDAETDGSCRWLGLLWMVMRFLKCLLMCRKVSQYSISPSVNLLDYIRRNTGFACRMWLCHTHECEKDRAAARVRVWVCARMAVWECEGVKGETASRQTFETGYFLYTCQSVELCPVISFYPEGQKHVSPHSFFILERVLLRGVKFSFCTELC